MKRTHWKRVLSMIMVLAMMVSLTAALACSDEAADTVPHYDHYVCLGDSIAAGFGPDADDRHGFNKIDFAYHTKVADAVGATQFDQLAYPAFRTHEIRYILDEDYEGDSAMFALVTDCDKEVAAGYREMYREAIRNADLITLDVGTNDFFSIPLFTLLAALRADSPLDLSCLTENVDPESSTGAFITKLAGLLEEGANLPTAVPTYLTTLTECCQAFMENWDAICKIIYELNPDVKLVAVSRMNPFYTVKFTSADLVEVGRALDMICVAMNTYVKYQSPYASQYTYADIMGTECYQVPALTDDNFLADLTVNVHPTHAGHEFITERILNALNRDAESSSSLPFTDLPASMKYTKEIGYCYANGYMVGISDHEFAPDMNINRAMFATTLYAISGKPDVSGTCPFTDVPSDSYYYTPVTWAAANGITAGVDAKSFAPTNDIRRQDMILMLYRYAGSPDVSGDLSSYTDSSKISKYATDAMIWAVENDLLIVNDQELAPKTAATRTDLAYALSHYDWNVRNG